MKRIAVAEPKFYGNEKTYVLDCLDSTWISSVGKYIGEFEKIFAEFCGVKHAIATNNGTTALHRYGKCSQVLRRNTGIC
jgi:perosamine synthetase